MQKDKKLLDGVVADYYNSIEEQFEYRLKNNWKIELTSFLRMFSILFVVFNVLPVLVFLDDEYLRFIFDLLKSKLGLSNVSFNFYVSWGIGVILSLLILGIVYIPYKIWDNRDIKKALKYRLMEFCYAYSLRKDIKSYLINENPIHLEKEY